MLDTRKCVAGHMDEFSLVPMPLGVALREASNFCHCFATISDIMLWVHHADTTDVVVTSNALQFQQVMISLISNAIKYSPPKSTVSIHINVATLERVENKEVAKALAVGINGEPAFSRNTWSKVLVAVILVSDKGTGIRDEHSNWIFGRFAQLEHQPFSSIGGSSIGQLSGTGLGLNLCSESIRRMNGKIGSLQMGRKALAFCFTCL